MIRSKCESPRNSAACSRIWGDLEAVCRTIHVSLYKKHNKTLVKRHQPQLEQILARLPKNGLAILREEGAALLHELKNEHASAIEHRKREIRLIERLQESVRKSIAAGDYDRQMGGSILEGRDSDALDARRAILRSLEERKAPRKKRPVALSQSHRPKAGAQRKLS